MPPSQCCQPVLLPSLMLLAMRIVPAFETTLSEGEKTFDILIDMLFLADLGLNFVTGYVQAVASAHPHCCALWHMLPAVSCAQRACGSELQAEQHA